MSRLVVDISFSILHNEVGSPVVSARIGSQLSPGIPCPSLSHPRTTGNSHAQLAVLNEFWGLNSGPNDFSVSALPTCHLRSPRLLSTYHLY